ncbi:adenylate/guanylate cyclase domain-containing protein [Reyranella sp. CPCC 100927]|uniref:adenylate/guanylate cyclase domain-containing protein n=1 Tax=Reyranella sp. CPCC 100927 TaxID=2599616 RepID=UPI0011B744D0|nr:adenylate/guanylate cyclase domain-containing protein [Reyranella sp. CPCC 100927]TWT15896.1 adenylate/guanylate cyclase domain-containing protein [Reyranella sp. CPCC 100927]
MAQSRMDPAPRQYPPFVALLRRAARGPAAAPERTTADEIEAWLLREAVREEDMLPLYESLVWRLVAAGLPLDRSSVHVGTLHPQLIGFAWNWNRTDGLCDEVKVPEAALKSDSYRRNPLFRVNEYGESVRCNLGDAETIARFPLMAELAAQGITEYIALALGGGAYHNAVTVATKQAGGFSDSQRTTLERLFALFALHIERHIAQRIAGNVLDTYLGTAAGGKVLRGAIHRGSGEPIRAIIWVSDLRGFTDLADRLEGAEMIALLNAYFERLAGAVLDHGGEVLKFIGDGLLAVFPFTAFGDEAQAAAASLAAAQAAMAAIEHLNVEPPPELARIGGWQPLRSGIALHEGDVFFGNVGAEARLDFTVIGRAVNAASRVEALTKTLGRSILITEPVARRLERPLDLLGAHALRGLAEPVPLYGLKP